MAGGLGQRYAEYLRFDIKYMKSKMKNYHDDIKLVFEGFFILVGLVYSIGFLVVNSYLFGYGTIEFEIIKIKYISTGLLVVFILIVFTSVSLPRIMIDRSSNFVYYDNIFIAINHIVIVSLFLLFLILFFPSTESRFSIPENLVIRYLCHSLILVSIVLSIVASHIKDKEKYRNTIRIFSMISVSAMTAWSFLSVQTPIRYLTLWGLSYFFILYYLFSPKVNASDSGDPDIEVSKPNSLLYRYNWNKWSLFFVFLIVLIMYFGKYIYPEINPAIGGGKPIKAKLVPYADKIGDYQLICDSLEIKIIDQTSKYIYVIYTDTSKSKLMQIDKNLISGVIYNYKE